MDLIAPKYEAMMDEFKRCTEYKKYYGEIEYETRYDEDCQWSLIKAPSGHYYLHDVTDETVYKNPYKMSRFLMPKRDKDIGELYRELDQKDELISQLLQEINELRENGEADRQYHFQCYSEESLTI